MDKFFVWLWEILDLPALLLIAIMGIIFHVLNKIQKDPANDFDFADMLRDDNGKPSSARLMILICGAVTSWGFMYILIHNPVSTIDPLLFLGYAVIWSGAKIAERMIDAWENVKGTKS